MANYKIVRHVRTMFNKPLKNVKRHQVNPSPHFNAHLFLIVVDDRAGGDISMNLSWSIGCYTGPSSGNLDEKVTISHIFTSKTIITISFKSNQSGA